MKSLFVHGVCVLLCSILSLTCLGLCDQCPDIEIAGVPSGLPSCSAYRDTVDGKYYVCYDSDTHKAILLFARTTTSIVVVPSTVEVNISSWSEDCIEQFKVVGVKCGFDGATSVEFPDGILVDNGLFSCSKSIESVILPSDLKRIPGALFKNCPNLRSVIGPTAVESVGENAFDGCTSLNVIPETGLIRNVENSGFQGCRSLGAFSSSELRTVGDNAFRGCSSLTSFLIPEGLVAIGSMAFYGADSLESVGLPVGIREIGEKAFACSGVAHATFPVDLSEEIGGIAMFAGCENLVDVNLPNGLQYIPEEMFAFCSSLTNVDIPASVERIGAGAFVWTGLKNVILPDGLKKIEAETFDGCESLESISWPSELSEIGRLAFFRTCITNADFTGTKLAVVGDRAFDSCGALTNGVFFPRTLHTLGSQSLSGIGSALIGWYYKNMPYDKMDSYPRLTVSFLGPPPDAGDDLLAHESEWNATYLGNNCIYKYMTYEPEFQEAWEEAIASYQASHIEKTWDWHNLTVKKIIVVEPTDWKLEKGGRQTLTISWHFPTNATYTIDQATTDLKALGKRYKIYRGKDDKKYWDDFSKKECIVESTSDLSYPDKSFGDIKGTHPVRYWVEVIGEDAINTPEPVHCDTRRRFGLAVGVSTYGEGMKETPVGGFVADTRKFVSMLESSYDGCKIDEILDLHATVENISQRIRALPFEDNGKKRIVPGDMVFLWIATHGGEDGSIAAYNGYYGNSVSSVYNAHDTAMNVTSCLRSDLSWVGGEPGVRVVCLFPFCHSRAVWQGFDSFLNCAFIGATRKIDVSVLDNLKTQFGTYFLGYGVAKGLANLSGISGSPYADLGEDGFDVPPHVCNSQSGNTVTLDELGRYAKSLAFGASWKKRARAVVERPELLSTFIMAEGCMAVKGNVPGLPELSPHETDSGIINLHYKLPKGCTSAIFWFREKRESAEWHWFTLDFAASDARRFGRDVGVLEWIWEVTVNDRKPFVPFGTQTQEERTYRGVVRPDTEYEFALQGVNEFGYGVTRHIRVPYRTGADLPMVAREVFVREFREMRNYLGRLNKKGINASVCITPDGDFWTICLSLDENGSPVEYIGRASRNDISDNGVMKVNVSCKTKALKFSANSASEEIALPNSFDLNVSIDCVEGANSDFGLSCIPVAEVGFDEYAACPGVQFQVDPPVSSLLGEVSYSAKSLPRGLSIDPSTGVISGTPTEPGSYVVLVTVKSKTDPTQTETIEVPIVIGNYVDETIAVDDEYGPFAPGEKVELKFPEGAAWKVTGLPTGLKWDAKLPGVTGVPTKPGTNTVTFTWTDKTVKPNVTHTASSTFIVGPLPSVVEQMITNTIAYFGLEGAANPNPTQFTTNDLPLVLSPLSRNGWRFLGWSPNGGVIPVGTVTNVSFTATWEDNRVPIVLPDGSVLDARVGGEVTLPLALPKPGHALVGWLVDGEIYKPGDRFVLSSASVSVEPIYEPYALYGEEAVSVREGEVAPYEKAAAVYDGYLYDADGNVAGTVQVKVAKGKADRKTGAFAAKATATVQLADGTKKISFKNGVADAAGNVTGLMAAGRTLSISLGVNGMGGTMDGYSVDGARNLFAAKDAEAKATAAAIEKQWVGAVNVVGGDVALAVSIAKKGKVKVSGTAGGAKVSATSQLLVGDGGVCCVPVVITKKANLAFNLWLLPDRGVELAGLDGVEAGKAGTLRPGAAFSIEDGGAALAEALPELLDGFLPDGVPVAANGKKWVVAPDEKGKDAKAGKVAIDKKTGEIDETKLGANPSGLKLTYTAKSGTFKGSFKAYAIVNGKIKSYTVNVTGVMLGDKALGTATLKKPAVSFPIAIE